MNNLLPQDVLQMILEETGAIGNAKPSSVVRSVTHFKPFRLQKRPPEFNVSDFDPGFDQVAALLQKDWQKNFVPGSLVTRQNATVQSLKKYPQRETSFCAVVNLPDSPEPALLYFSADAFYLMMNHYLGGGVLSHTGSARALTEIEATIFERITQSFCENFTKGFEVIHPIPLEVKKIPASHEDQKDYLKNDYLLIEFTLAKEGVNSSFVFAMPVTYLKSIKKEGDQKEGAEQNKMDPIWQRVVTQTVLSLPVELKINVGEFQIPFEKSLALQVGDVFPWDKFGPNVIVSFLDRPRIKGTIGAVGDVYAIKVEEIL